VRMTAIARIVIRSQGRSVSRGFLPALPVKELEDLPVPRELARAARFENWCRGPTC
jgi:hypothetical protein